jgi:hypothetical protein
MLNIVSKSEGNYDPYVKYNAKAGRWYVKGDNGEVEVQNPVFVPDFANIKTGWLYFAEGQAPSKVFDAQVGLAAEKPSPNHKRGFQLRLFSKNSFGGVVELASSSMHLCASIQELYEAYDAAAESKAGKLPVVKFTGSTPMKDKMGTNYKPNFVIEKWVDRPVELATDSNVVQLNTPTPAAQPVAVAAVSEF